MEASFRNNRIVARHTKTVRASNEVDLDTAFPRAKFRLRDIAC